MKKVMLSALPSVEPLEARIAPAAVFTFTDVDGDEVKITTSKGSNEALAAVITPFLIDSGSGKLLQKLDLAANPVFKGTNLTITATGSGDGSVDVGYIDATGIDLGRVKVSGDVGQIDAGDSKLSSPAIKSLEVGSLGAEGLTTQGAADASLVSTINGALLRFTATGDVQGTITVEGGAKGRIGSVEIGGSLIGGDQQLSGSISASGAIGSVLISGNLQGGSAANTGYIAGASLKSITVENNIIGGDGEYSGAVKIRGNIGQVLVKENVTGGTADTADHSAEVRAGGFIKSTRIMGHLTGGGGDNSGAVGSGLGLGSVSVDGGITGGDGFESGTVGSDGKIDKVTIGAGITGGGGEKSGAVLATARIDEVTVNGNIVGGEGRNSGVIATNGGLGEVTVSGSVKGGNGEESGAIGSRKMLESVSITGNIEGGGGVQSGAVVSSIGLGKVSVEGSVIGGSRDRSGSIGSLGTVRSVVIGGDLQGMDGSNSGVILSATAISKVEIGGSILGGDGFSSGVINSSGVVGTVRVAQDLVGGSEFLAGSIRATRSIQNVEVGGSVIGGSESSTGIISTRGAIGNVTIGNNLEGSSGSVSGAIEAYKINNVLIGNDILGGTGMLSGVIRTLNFSSEGLVPPQTSPVSTGAPEPVLGRIKILGDVVGGEGPESGSIISDGRIDSISIGRVGSGGGEDVFDLQPSDSLVAVSGIGSLIGGTGYGSGNIYADGNIGTITIYRDVVGGFADNESETFSDDRTGRIYSGGSIQKLTIGRDLVGGDSYYGSSSEGGGGDAGQVYARGRIGTVDIGGSVRGGFGEHSAEIRAGAIGTINIEGSAIAGPGNYSAAFVAEVLDIGSIKIVGELTTDTGISNGEAIILGGYGSVSIAAARNIGKVDIGSIDGNPEARVMITAAGQVGAKNDAQALAIASVTVRNGSAFADILAGYDNTNGFFLDPVNPDAQIGTVTVGDPKADISLFWQFTNVVAGAEAGFDGIFGTDDDVVIDNPDASSKVISKIAKVVIYGSNFLGSEEGIVAEQVGSIIAIGQKVPLQAGPKNDFITIQNESGLTVNEPKSIFLPQV